MASSEASRLCLTVFSKRINQQDKPLWLISLVSTATVVPSKSDSDVILVYNC